MFGVRFSLLFILVVVLARAADAQAEDAVPKGGCMPIGWTASGEVVFPIECKALLEKQRGSPLPAAPDLAPQAAAPDPAPKVAAPDVAPKVAAPDVAPKVAAPETAKPAVADTTQLDAGQKAKQSRDVPRRRRVVNPAPAVTGSVTQPKKPPSN